MDAIKRGVQAVCSEQLGACKKVSHRVFHFFDFFDFFDEEENRRGDSGDQLVTLAALPAMLPSQSSLFVPAHRPTKPGGTLLPNFF